MKKVNKVSLKYILWKEGKHYVAQCLNVDVSSFGETKKEAMSNITEALELYFEDSKIKVIKLPKLGKPEVHSASVKYA
ncbi:MAG: type II toxin-antitoxin system HicB family antitoxin [Bacteroidia bacterium]